MQPPHPHPSIPTPTPIPACFSPPHVSASSSPPKRHTSVAAYTQIAIQIAVHQYTYLLCETCRRVGKNGSCKHTSVPVSALGVCFIKARRAAEPVTFRSISRGTKQLHFNNYFFTLTRFVDLRLLSPASRTKWFPESGFSSLTLLGILSAHRILRDDAAALMCSSQCDKKTKTTFNLFLFIIIIIICIICFFLCIS